MQPAESPVTTTFDIPDQELLDRKLFDRLVEMRRDLHQHPELSWDEHRTSDRIAAFLDDLGLVPRRGVAGTGIVAEIPGRVEGPCVALRADMDALPIQEETGLPFASRIENRMHACAHDGHSTILLGAAALLAREAPPPVPVRLLFQPAEETGDGAKSMIADGALEGVACIFGGHLDRHFDVGTVAVTDGAVNASSDRFHVEIGGRGGHAARPHEAVDAVVVGSLFVMALQTIVSREVNPAHPSVVTVGRFDAGTASNVIAGRASLSGSIRAQDAIVREHLHRSINRIAKSIGELHDATINVEIAAGTPPLVNDPALTDLARRAVVGALGENALTRMEVANMGGEDFAYYVERIPGCYVRIGGRVPGREGFPAHSSRFDFDERAIAVGARYYHALARVAGEEVAARV